MSNAWPCPLQARVAQLGRELFPGESGRKAEALFWEHQELRRNGRPLDAAAKGHELFELGYLLDATVPLGYRPRPSRPDLGRVKIAVGQKDEPRGQPGLVANERVEVEDATPRRDGRTPLRATSGRTPRAKS